MVVIDAARTGAPAGSVLRFDAAEKPLPAGFFRSSTHAFGVAEAVELARALGRLPGRVVVYGIEGRSFEAGGRLSKEVRRAVEEVAARVASEEM